jgi:hypothetical protein
MHLSYKIIVSILFFSNLVACIPDTDSSSTSTSTTSISPSIEFTLFNSEQFVNGYSQSISLTGFDTAGGTQTGTYTVQTQAATTYNNQSAIPSVVTLSITNTKTGASASSTGTEYYSSDLNNLKYLGFTNISSGVTTASATPTAFPKTAKIGDFGNVGVYVNSDGIKDTTTWKLTDAGNGSANFVTLSTTLNQNGTLNGRITTTVKINSSGVRSGHIYKIYIAESGITLTLNGS